MAGARRTLRVSYDTRRAFQSEYTSDLVNGGIFVPTEEAIEVREPVVVEVDLAFAGKRISLEGEVVHVVSPELATTGATPGCAIQFSDPLAELRARFQDFVGGLKTPEETEAEKGRRAAPRCTARIRARVHCPGAPDLVGRTRNLSSSGVLVSISGEPFDVDEPVQVFLENPRSGREREILGKVARHVQGDGGEVRAIGIQFYVPPAEAEDFETFLRELTTVAHSRRLGGIQGSIEELGLASLVQTFAAAAKEGTLELARGGEEGTLAFERGKLRHAETAGVRGVKALARMLAWPEGRFEFHARIDRDLPRAKAIALDAALLEAERLIDESARVDRSNFRPEAVLKVDPARRDEAAGTLTKLEDAVLDLAAAGMSVQRVLDVIPVTDDEIYLALESLADAGLLDTRD